ncbi:MAG: group III truncated hemoglobin [Parvibaculaceae bacterium]
MTKAVREVTVGSANERPAEPALSVAGYSVRPEVTAALMAETGLDDARLTALVHRFYDKIRRDPVLGPIFAERIKDWDAHLERMVSFWSSVALMTGRYSGTPMQAHARLPVEWPHFERWLALFSETAAETCPPEGASFVIERARRIAQSLHMAVEDARGEGLRIRPPQNRK